MKVSDLILKGSVFKRKDGRWTGSVAVKDISGKWKKKYVYGETKKETTRKLNDLIYKLENNLFKDNQATTFNSLLLEWYKIHSPKLAETTKSLYKMYIDKHINPLIGHIKIKDLKPNTLDKFYNKKLETLSPNTVIKLHKLIHIALNYAVKNDLMATNISDNVSLPKQKKYKPQIYDEENFKKLLNAVTGTFDEIPILLAGVVGLRRGEIFGLRWRDVDFKKSTLTIEETKVRWDKYMIKDPKSEASNRVLKVPAFLIQVLKEYLDTLSIVPERICEKYRPDSYTKRFKRLLTNFNLPKTRLHDLRHYNAVIMLKYHIPDKVASERLGHSQTVLRTTYQHVLKDMHQEAADTIEAVFLDNINK